MIYLIMLMQLGVQINNPNQDKIVIVRTLDEPMENHHPVLDRAEYTDLKPYTVTIRAHDKAIHTITLEWVIVDNMNVSHTLPQIFTMPPGGAVVKKNDTCEFWPGGRMCKNLGPHPIMSMSGWIKQLLAGSTFVGVSVDFIEFDDGSTMGPNQDNTQRRIELEHFEDKRKGNK